MCSNSAHFVTSPDHDKHVDHHHDYDTSTSSSQLPIILYHLACASVATPVDCLRWASAGNGYAAQFLFVKEVKDTSALGFRVAVFTSALIETLLSFQSFPPSTMLEKKKKEFTSFGRPTRLITCANRGNAKPSLARFFCNEGAKHLLRICPSNSCMCVHVRVPEGPSYPSNKTRVSCALTHQGPAPQPGPLQPRAPVGSMTHPRVPV